MIEQDKQECRRYKVSAPTAPQQQYANKTGGLWMQLSHPQQANSRKRKKKEKKR